MPGEEEKTAATATTTATAAASDVGAGGSQQGLSAGEVSASRIRASFPGPALGAVGQQDRVAGQAASLPGGGDLLIVAAAPSPDVSAIFAIEGPQRTSSPALQLPPGATLPSPSASAIPSPSGSGGKQACLDRWMSVATAYVKKNNVPESRPVRSSSVTKGAIQPVPVCRSCSRDSSAARFVEYPDPHRCLCSACHEAGKTATGCPFCLRG